MIATLILCSPPRFSPPLFSSSLLSSSALILSALYDREVTIPAFMVRMVRMMMMMIMMMLWRVWLCECVTMWVWEHVCVTMCVWARVCVTMCVCDHVSVCTHSCIPFHWANPIPVYISQLWWKWWSKYWALWLHNDHRSILRSTPLTSSDQYPFVCYHGQPARLRQTVRMICRGWSLHVHLICQSKVSPLPFPVVIQTHNSPVSFFLSPSLSSLTLFSSPSSLTLFSSSSPSSPCFPSLSPLSSYLSYSPFPLFSPLLSFLSHLLPLSHCFQSGDQSNSYKHLEEEDNDVLFITLHHMEGSMCVCVCTVSVCVCIDVCVCV